MDRYRLLIRALKRLQGAPPTPGAARTYWYADSAELDRPRRGSDFDPSARTRVPEAEANLVSSLCESGLHAPTIDLDLPARLEPSSSPGHHHLYVDAEISWPRYVILLLGLTLSGLTSPSSFAHALRRRKTLLRRPGVKKPS